MSILPLLVSAWCAIAGAAARGGDPPPALPIVVSLPPQVWLVQSIGGPRVAVEALVGPGSSEETYSPTDAQVSAALRAKVFFRTGASFEEAPWFRALAGAKQLEIVDTRARIELLPLDPHVWLSPRSLAIQARTVASTLSRVDPEGRIVYERRLRDVIRELEILDLELTELLAPYRGRSFFVFHPAWGYFARDYGLRQVPIENEGNPPTDHELTRLQELARAARIRTLFVQPQIASRSAEAVASVVGATVVPLDPLAPDVPANLRRTATRLVESFAP